MNKYLALAVGAALATTATYTLAQAPSTGQSGTDKGTQSANPDMDKKKAGMTKGSGTAAPATSATPTPPGNDTPAGEGSTTSATPKK